MPYFHTLFNKILQKTPLKRRIFFIFSDFLLWIVSLYWAFRLTGINANTAVVVLYALFIFVPRIFFYRYLHLFDINWQFVSIGEVIDLSFAQFSSDVIAVLLLLAFLPGVLWRPLFAEFVISTFLVSFLIMSKRIYISLVKHQFGFDKRKALIIGGGENTEKLVRNMIESDSMPIKPYAIISSHQGRVGTFIHGIRVIGNLEEGLGYINWNIFDYVFIVDGEVGPEDVKKIIQNAHKVGIDTKVVSFSMRATGESIFNIRNVDVDDLLLRKQFSVNTELIEKELNHKKILVTGAAGSIGSEITAQLSRFNPISVVMLDIDETNTYLLYLKLKERFPYINYRYYIADIKDERRISNIFAAEKPDVVFHAAAYKHVPVMERFPDQALHVNVIGTFNAAKAALENNAERFILVSTDKAVKAVSIMGITKKIAEIIVKSMAGDSGTKFIIVRFGNVLGSRGSVIPIFMEQIKNGGPITITHPDMSRYFMTPKEAVALLLEAGAIGEQGDIFVLDMGEPVKIVEIAKELIKLQGFVPEKDIKIVYSGIRQGEKLTEELYSENERIETTLHSKIWRISKNGGEFELPYGEIVKEANRLLAEGNTNNIREYLNRFSYNKKE